MKFSGKVGNWRKTNKINFGGDPDHGSGYGSGYAPDPDLYHDTGKTCLGGGMHCPTITLCMYLFATDVEQLQNV